MFEEAETVLYEEDVAHSLIDCALFDFPIFQSRWKLVAIQVADHLHIQASVDGSHGRVSWIGSETVRCQILDGLPIGYHETCEVPALAKNIVQQPAISCSRHTIKVHVAAHQRTGTSLDASVERGQVDILQLLVGNVGLLIVTAACGGAIPGKMLKAGEQMVGRADVIALEPPDLSLRHPGTEIRILARAFHNATPSWIPSYIKHRCERPVDPRGRSLARSHLLRMLHQRGVPRCCQRKRDGIDRAEAVD